MEDFLSQFKRNENFRRVHRARIETEFFFMIAITDELASVSVVDSTLSPLSVADICGCGPEEQALRAIERIQFESSYEITWNIDRQDKAPAGSVSLDANPFLIYQLIACHNLINTKGKPLNVADSEAVVAITLTEEGNEITPTRTIRIGNEELRRFSFLSDSYVLATNTIYPIRPVGEHYHQLKFFTTPFHRESLEQYLSLLFSFLENIKVFYGNFETIHSEESASAEPVLIFDKVDVDKALYMHIGLSVNSLPVDFLEEFAIDRVVSLTHDNRILVRHIDNSALDEALGRLTEIIVRSAPNRKVQREIGFEGKRFIIPEETASPFLLEGLPAILGNFKLLGVEKLRDYRVKPVRPTIRLSLSSGIDYLDGELQLEVDGEKFSLRDLLDQYRRQRYITLNDNSRAILDENFMKRLERLFRTKKGSDKISISFFDLPEVEELMKERLDSDIFTRHRTIYEGFNTLAQSQIKLPAVNAELRNYQIEGVKWLKYLYDNKLGGCLADDMGLGKTLQTITLLAMLYPAESKPTLIVMPKSLLFNWQNELQHFAPQLSAYTYYGLNRNLDEALGHQLILTTYAVVRNDIAQFAKQDFAYIILDESQNIKSTSSQTTQAIWLLKADHRLALSGTPVENNLTELYSLFRFLNPAMFGSLDDFNHRYTYPIQHDNDKDELYALRRKIYPFLLRRLKKDVLTELPDRIDNTIYVEMSAEQSRYYDERRRSFFEKVREAIATEGIAKSQFAMLQALNELRRIASVPESMTEGRIASPKLEPLMEAVAEAVSNNHKVVIFFNYIAGTELVGEELKNLGIDFETMTGATTDRKRVVNRFQTDPKCMVLMMTLKTGGVGLNLTAADTVFIFEPWWNKAAEEQAVTRLHRFGQKATVLTYSIITRNSIEEKIALLQQKKAELFEGLVGSDTTAGKTLTEEDINYILG